MGVEICDVEGHSVIDLIEGRGAPDLDRWLAKQSEEWKTAVKVTVSDLHEPFRAALKSHLPDATAVADPFHVVAVATRCVDATLRRVQNETLGHRGRKGDPLYRSRKLLAMAEERLDEATTSSCVACSPSGAATGRSSTSHPAETRRTAFRPKGLQRLLVEATNRSTFENRPFPVTDGSVLIATTSLVTSALAG